MKEHIIINNDRTVIVPASVYKIGNQYEHNVNKVTFDCPRYADDEQTIDLSAMKIYINYIRPDKEPLSSLAENVIVDETDPTIIHFDFRITRNVTFAKGVLSCLVCIKSVNSEGIEEYHWNSDIFTKLTVGEGMENEEVISEENSDLITKLLLEVDTTKAEVNGFSDRIDSVDRKVGSLDLLSTEDKSSIVSAVNEVKKDSDDLKGDIANSKKAIAELNDKKITKFYASNLGNTNLQDSDSGKITDMKIFGKSEQKQYSGKNLSNCNIETTSSNGITCKNNGDGTYTLNGTATDIAIFNKELAIVFDNTVTYKLVGCPAGGSKSKYKLDVHDENQNYFVDFGNGVTFNISGSVLFIRFVIYSGTTLNNALFKPMITTDTSATYDDFEPYVGGIPSPNPDYPQEIEAVVNPAVELAGIARDGTYSNLLSDFQLKWLVENYDKWHDDEHIVLFSKQWNRLFVFNPNVYDDESDIFYYGYIIYPNVINVDNGRFNQYMYQITYYPYVYLYSAKEFTFKRTENQYLISSIADSYETVGIGSKIASLPYTLNAIPVSSGGNVTIDGQEYIADYVDIENKKLVRMLYLGLLSELKQNIMFSVDENWYDSSLSYSYEIKNISYEGHVFKNLGKKCLCSKLKTYTFDDFYNKSIENGIMNNQSYIVVNLSKSLGIDTIASFKEWIKDVYVLKEFAEPYSIDLTDEEVQTFKDLATYYPTTNVIVTSDQLDGYTEFNYPISMANGWSYVKQQLNDNRDYIYDMDLQSAEAYVSSEYAVALTELEV